MAEYKRHQGHRQRMRERVQNYGLDSLADQCSEGYQRDRVQPAGAVRGLCLCAGGQ